MQNDPHFLADWPAILWLLAEVSLTAAMLLPKDRRYILSAPGLLRSKHRCCPQIPACIATCEGPHIIFNAAGDDRPLLPRMGRARIVWKAVRDGSCVTKVVIIIKNGVGECLCHVPKNLCLSYQVAMFHVRYTAIRLASHQDDEDLHSAAPHQQKSDRVKA
jgi:hypothetical protein